MRKLRLLCLGILGPLVATLFPSCASQAFYNRVDGAGMIRGRPRVDWVRPDKFVYLRQENGGFSFQRSNGEVITPGDIETDGGSIPRALWSKEGFSPWTYAPAYLVHDWLYEAHRRGEPGGVSESGEPLYYTKDQADWIMVEIIKAQMENPELFDTEKSPGNLKSIHWAVSHFGETAWTDKPRKISGLITRPIGEVLDNLPLRPVLDTLQDGLIPAASAPPLEGTVTRQP